MNRKREYHKAAGIVDLKTATKEQLAEIRKTIIQRRRKNNLIFVLLFTVFVSPIVYFSFDSFKEQEKKTLVIKKMQKDKRMKKYNFFINDGDNYITKGQWHNAMFQYNKALEIFPNDYYAHYRYSYAAVYRCRNEKEKCELAEKYLKKLLEEFPDKSGLIELEQVLIFANE